MNPPPKGRRQGRALWLLAGVAPVLLAAWALRADDGPAKGVDGLDKRLRDQEEQRVAVIE
jgi:hypothetical protein